MNKTEMRHIELREKLIESAEEIIRERGLPALKSREVTASVGCSLGALYNVLNDLDNLIMCVNSRTLSRMGEYLRKSTREVGGGSEERLWALADAYIQFAMDNTNLWLALFQFRVAKDHGIPDWYRREHFVLISQIIEPLRVLVPNMSDEDLLLRARTTFAAVHGVIIFSLENGYVAVPIEDLRSEVRALVGLMARGAVASMKTEA